MGLADFLRVFKAIEKFMGGELFFSEECLRGVLDLFEETSGFLLNIEGLFEFLPFLANFD